jgi:hypothetical protein
MTGKGPFQESSSFFTALLACSELWPWQLCDKRNAIKPPDKLYHKQTYLSRTYTMLFTQYLVFWALSSTCTQNTHIGSRICFRLQVLKRTYQVGPLQAILGHWLARSKGPARFDERRRKQSRLPKPLIINQRRTKSERRLSRNTTRQTPTQLSYT